MGRNRVWRYLFFFILIFPLFVFTYYRIRLEKNSIDELSMVSFSVGNNDVQSVNVWQGDDGVYYVFLPSECNKIEPELAKGQSLVLNGVKYSNEDDLDIQCENIYDVSLYGKRDKMLRSGRVMFLRSDNIPSVYIQADCENTDMIVREKDEKIDVFITSVDLNGMIDFSGKCTLKGRGNSSWKNKKRPYNLNFAKEETILGMNPGKKWALIANGNDSSLLKNKITNMLSQKWRMEYTPQMEYINLYVNGNYQGVYLLSQKITAKDGCFSWDEQKQNVLFERDARYEEEKQSFKTEYCGIVYESTLYSSAKDVEEYRNIFTELESIIFDEERKSVLQDCSQLIDLDSWIKQYMIEEFVANADMDFASRYYYQREDSSTLYAGPLWDFDNSMGKITVTDGDIPANIMRYGDVWTGYFHRLMQYEDFRTEFIDYYQEEFVGIIGELLANDLGICINLLKESMAMDDVRWDKDNGFDEEAAEVIGWLEKRNVFWKEYWGNEASFCCLQLGGGCGVYCIKKGEEIQFLPDDILGKQVKWIDTEGNEVSAGITISQDMELLPVYLEE